MSFSTEVGDLVEFTYNGGSHPGSSRVVAVKSVDSSGFAGEDVFNEDANKYRRFELSKVSNFKLLRRQPVVKDTAKYDPSVGVVFENKRGDKLTLAVSPVGFSVSLDSNGKSVGARSFSLPTDRSNVISDTIDLLKRFSV
jgi:hypothetical protein